MKCLNKLFAFPDRKPTTTTTTYSANEQQQRQQQLEQQLSSASKGGSSSSQEKFGQPQEGSIRFTSALYAVTFVADLQRSDLDTNSSGRGSSSRVAILADGEPLELNRKRLGAKATAKRKGVELSPAIGLTATAAAIKQPSDSSLVSYSLPTATIGSETIASTSVNLTSAANSNRATAIVGASQCRTKPAQGRPPGKGEEEKEEEEDNDDYHYYCCQRYDCNCKREPEISVAAATSGGEKGVGGGEDEDEDEDEGKEEEEYEDWILVDSSTTDEQPEPSSGRRDLRKQNSPTVGADRATSAASKLQLQVQLQQMALDANSVELVKASWIPVRRDPVASGALLFKGLFTKFPQYLKFFPQFVDLDLECLQENKRLLRHAVKVIETITFVVDSIGDDSKSDQLDAALVSLVRGHLKRRIGLAEFRNLGIVVIDFICDINNRREAKIDTKLLVAAWTKMYSGILDLVKREEGNSSD